MRSAAEVLSPAFSLQVGSRRGYHENIVEHYENPRNVGSLDAKKKTVGTGLVGAPACGDVMKVQFEVDASGKIVDAKFKTFGCGSAIASSSLATEWLKGKTVDECLAIKVRMKMGGAWRNRLLLYYTPI
jgi:NifU-like protein involved in Fe-S cluster formation